TETAREFRWHDVITCEEGLDPQDERKIVTAIENHPLIREAIFLFTGKTLVRLEHISHKGIWISFLGALHDKAVYRVSVQTRDFGSFDLAININKNLSKDDVAAEISWLICAGLRENTPPLVEDFGGYWSKFDLWTEEFIPGESVDAHLKRLSRKTDNAAIERMRNLWPHFVWSALNAYIEFWNRTGRRLEIADPTPTNIIVPFSDFQVGARIVSISARKPFESLPKMMLSFRDNFVLEVEQKHPPLRGRVGWSIIFASFVDVLGHGEALQLFENTEEHLKGKNLRGKTAKLLSNLRKFIKEVKAKGHLSKRPYFAIKRFNRWYALNPNATPHAKLQTLQELATTYTVNEIDKIHPGSRIQLFRDTVFARNEEIKEGLNLLIRRMRSEPEADNLIDLVSKLKTEIPFSEEENFYLTRMAFPHLGPEDSARLVSLQKHGMPSTALLVFFEDHEGNKFGIRQPANPKEIAKLHGLYSMANLAIEFRPEHQYLVVLNDRLQVIGGIFYRFVQPRHVHLEKIVVDRKYRKKGVSNGLMQEFFNRLKIQDVQIVTVGFLRPEFFYKYGFRIEHSYGNMVKKLEESDTPGVVATLQNS
ncbi:MAG: GNAT family N-acetyltransferase, partial [bacterium]